MLIIEDNNIEVSWVDILFICDEISVCVIFLKEVAFVVDVDFINGDGKLTLFDNQLKTCNYAYKVDCIHNPILIRSTLENCINFHLTRSTKDCSKFYKCIENNSLLIELDCPKGTLFDAEYKICNLPKLVRSTTDCNTNLYSYTTIIKQTNRDLLIKQNETECPKFDSIDILDYFCSLNSFLSEFPHCCI